MKKQKQNSHTYKQNNHMIAIVTRPKVVCAWGNNLTLKNVEFLL